MADNNAQDNVGVNDRLDGAGEGLAVNDGADTGKSPGATPTELPAADGAAGMRSTAANTGGEAASQGLWRSYYAQQRERDAALNDASYRREHYRDVPVVHHGPVFDSGVIVDHIPVEHHSTFDYRAGHIR